MARARLHFGETRQLDVFAMYDSGRSDLRFGTSRSRGRSLNCINMSGTNDLDEWGGGLVYSQTAIDGALPFKLYSIFKRTESHTTKLPVPRERPARKASTESKSSRTSSASCSTLADTTKAAGPRTSSAGSSTSSSDALLAIKVPPISA